MITITDDAPARLEFFNGVLMEDMLDSYIAALGEVPAIVEKMRNIA